MEKKSLEGLDKATDKIINKGYGEYKQREVVKKLKNPGESLDKHVLSPFLPGIFQVLKNNEVKKLQKDIENDSIIRDQMARLGCHLAQVFVKLFHLFYMLSM